MLAVEMVTCTDDVSGCSGSMSAVAATSAKWPRTVIMPRCLAENSTCVWYGSSCQLPIANLPRMHGLGPPPQDAQRHPEACLSICISGGCPQHMSSEGVRGGPACHGAARASVG